MVADQAASTSRELARVSRGEALARQGIAQGDGTTHYTLSCPDIHCGACIGRIERGLSRIDGVQEARVNLTLKRVALKLDEAKASILSIVDELERLGYQAMPLDDSREDMAKAASAELLKALAVAGFAAMNIMLLSVSAWSGADGSTRDLFHLISALIAVPTLAYSGRIFFRSALKALKNGHLNMDVPISLAVILATGMSLYETLNHGEEAYFDAAVSLLFFLLIGRYLDQLMRERARNAVLGMSQLSVKGANVIEEDGSTTYRPIDEIKAGHRLLILPGERIPVDGVIEKGVSDLDISLVTGENQPTTLDRGASVSAGTFNLTGVLEIRATQSAEKSFLAQVSQMLGAAERGRGQYVRMADRMAQIYAPAVHLLAALSFVYWMFVGGDWHASLYIAISVLIITCPCALGLAVPVVHVVAASRLFEEGILVKDGSALERMAEIDHAVFDKTGTLTTPLPEVKSAKFRNDIESRLALSLSALSSHPASHALHDHLRDCHPLPLLDINERAGSGVEAEYDGKKIRLGAPAFVGEIASSLPKNPGQTANSQIFFAVKGKPATVIEISESLRPGARELVDRFISRGIACEILSGDKPRPVNAIAGKLGISTYRSELTPADKIAHIEQLKSKGEHPLMVGDGLNDAPGLAAGHASMAPASASDIGRAAADFVFTRDSLSSISFTLDVSRLARRLVKQNFGLAIIYNCIAVPLAFAGFVTPLFAAIAMSLSSIIVVANSMRLTRFGKTIGIRRAHSSSKHYEEQLA